MLWPARYSLDAILRLLAAFFLLTIIAHDAHASAQPHAASLIGDRSYTYDLNGNQTGWDHVSNGTRRTITWDEENRIQAIADNGHTLTYVYDDAGERVIKSGPQGETAYVNQFFVVRNREVATKHVFAGGTRLVSKMASQPDVTPPTAGNSGQAPWGWLHSNAGGNSPNSGGTVFEKDQYYFHPDHLGSSSYVTDIDGEIFQHLEYFPFGETFVEESSNTQRTPYLFTGKELDEATGLYYFGARYYDPRTSLWQSPDPVLADYMKGKRSGEGVFTPVNLNLFGYVQQRPLVMIDPDGTVTLPEARASLTTNGAIPADDYQTSSGESIPVYSDTQVLEEWFRLEDANTKWQEGVPGCPSRVRAEAGYLPEAGAAVWRPLEKVGRAEGAYHPGAIFSMRSQPNDFGAGCQCIYGSDGAIVRQSDHREMVRGSLQDQAGTMDFVSPNGWNPIGVLRHRLHDVDPYNLAGKLGRLDEYFVRRPLVIETSQKPLEE